MPALDRRRTWLVPQVRQLQEGAAQLRTVYAGEHAEAIASREQEVLQGWKELLAACEDARLHVSSTADALRFHSQARDLLSWMDGIAGQIGAADKPRCSLTHFQIPNKPLCDRNREGPDSSPATCCSGCLLSFSHNSSGSVSSRSQIWWYRPVNSDTQEAEAGEIVQGTCRVT